MLVARKGFTERLADARDRRLDGLDCRSDVLPCALQGACDAVDEAGDGFHAAAISQEVGKAIDDSGLEVTNSAFDGSHRGRSFDCRITHTKLHDSLVELLGGDQALCHSITEVARIRPVGKHGLLELTRCTRDGICKLVPVLRSQLACTGGLGHHHGDTVERVSIATGNGVQVACRFGKGLVVCNTIRRKLGRGVRHSFQVINCPGCVVLDCLSAGFDFLGSKASKGHCGLELGQRVSGV